MKNSITSLMLLLALTIISSIAKGDIKMQVGDSFSFTVKEPIEVAIGQSIVRLEDTAQSCGLAIVMQQSERYSRTIKAGTTCHVKITKLSAYRGYNNERLFLYGMNRSLTSEVNGIYTTYGTPPLLSDLISTFSSCPHLKFERFIPSGHEGSVEVE